MITRQIPILTEQRRIMAKVEQRMALVDQLESQLAASRATAEKLLLTVVAEHAGAKSTGHASKPSASGPPARANLPEILSSPNSPV